MNTTTMGIDDILKTIQTSQKASEQEQALTELMTLAKRADEKSSRTNADENRTAMVRTRSTLSRRGVP